MKNSIIAINVFNKDTLLNKDGYPILFDKYGDDDIVETIINNDSFKNFIKSKDTFKNIDNYGCTSFVFSFYNNETEKYESGKVNIQDIYKLDSLEKNDFILDDLYKIFTYLYYVNCNENWTYASDNKQKQLDIIRIKHILITDNKVTEETLIQYIISVLEENNLNKENIDYILIKLKQIFNYGR